MSRPAYDYNTIPGGPHGLRAKIRPAYRNVYSGQLIWIYTVVDTDGNQYVSDNWATPNLKHIYEAAESDVIALRRTLSLGNQIQTWNWLGRWG